jgi:hypothetical protein
MAESRSEGGSNGTGTSSPEKGYGNWVRVIVVLITTIGVVAAAYIRTHGGPPPPPPTATAAPSPATPSATACGPADKVEVDGVPPQSGPALDFAVVVRCGPPPDSEYWLVTRFDNEGTPPHPEWYPLQAVSAEVGTHLMEIGLTGRGVTRHLFVVSCTSVGVQHLSSQRFAAGNPHSPLLAFPTGCDLMSNEAEVTLQ